jgi:hypothetical protein
MSIGFGGRPDLCDRCCLVTYRQVSIASIDAQAPAPFHLLKRFTASQPSVERFTRRFTEAIVCRSTCYRTVAFHTNFLIGKLQKINVQGDPQLRWLTATQGS